ncbi:MAG: bifunctional precorrin-2 dehydrogenase/sirohydrochlorin ferrochelatase [Coriobacteriia bacterium]|nr:bifunctional precorrin-2 dehydrogenase/sirohydrochlorin ferrochelatase [Coriobacteriia bacterium]MBN2822479.1 bifunctional precorrin-2 dehydrogenase/sirohydrochlorin ferrochelatase [Coriobacteriia bacterium]
MSRDYTTRYYPVYLDLGEKLAVVVGGGAVAARKIRTLVEYGARVVVVAPEVVDELEQMATEGLVEIQRRGYVRGDLDQAFLVVCATDSEETNRAVYDEAQQRGCLVNVVDVPELCNFIVPSIVRRGQLQLAISTGGAAPTVAKRLRRHVEDHVGQEWGPYIELLGEVRTLVMERVPGGELVRKPIFEAIGASDLLERIRAGVHPSAEDVYAEFVGGDQA